MYSLALLNGGVGSRIAADRPKQFIRVNGVPTMVYSLVVADAVAEITQIVLNYPEGWRDDVESVVRDYAIRTPVSYVAAGSTRQESVRRMIPSCVNDRIVVHESARPLVTVEDFRRLVDDPHENVSLMLPIPFTVAPVDPGSRRVTGYLERSLLRNVQLPQKFTRETLVTAHEYAEREGLVFTEDATMCVAAGAEVFFIDGSDRNIKVTTRTDVRLAGFLLGGGDEDG